MPRTATIEKTKGKTLPDQTAPIAGATNGPDREEALFMMGQFLASKAKIKEARNADTRLRNQAKLRGFDLEQFDRAIAEREREDGTTLDNLLTFKRYCMFLGLPIGSQLELLANPASNGHSQEDINERAHDDGYELGLMGKNADEQAYPPMTPEGQEHMRGWHAGQEVLLEKFKDLNAKMEAADVAAAAKKKAKASKGAEPEGEATDAETKH